MENQNNSNKPDAPIFYNADTPGKNENIYNPTPNTEQISTDSKILNRSNKNKKIAIVTLVTIVILAIFIFIFLIGFEYYKATKFINAVEKLRTSAYYSDYLAKTNNFLKSNNGLYAKYASCGIVSADSIWDFKAEDGTGNSLSLGFTNLDSEMRGYQAEVNKNLPKIYTKNIFSFANNNIDASLIKWNQINDFNNSLNPIFDSSDHGMYCRNIYDSVIEDLSQVKINANGTNTVVSGADTPFYINKSNQLANSISQQSSPIGLENINKEFANTISEIANTYKLVLVGANTSDSVRRHQIAFQSHKQNLDNNLASLSQAAKPYIKWSPGTVQQYLDSAEQLK